MGWSVWKACVCISVVLLQVCKLSRDTVCVSNKCVLVISV